MATMMTFGEYSKRTGVNKGTIKRCAEKLGIDTSEGLSQDAIAALEAEYSMFTQVRPATAETIGETRSTVAPLIVGEKTPDGLDTPAMPTTKLKAPTVLGETMGDPLALAKQFCGGIDQMLEQNSHYLQALEKRAEDTRQAVQMMQDAAKRAALHQREFEIQTAIKSEFLKRDAEAAMRISGTVKG